MNTQLTPRALDVIADSGETGEHPLRNAAPGSSGGGSGEAELLRKALLEAATSLETIGRLAGLGECMLEDSEVRAYAHSRASVARAAIAAATGDRA